MISTIVVVHSLKQTIWNNMIIARYFDTSLTTYVVIKLVGYDISYHKPSSRVLNQKYEQSNK